MLNKAKLWRSGLYFCDISIFFLSVTAVLSLTWPLNTYTHPHTHTLGRCGMGLAEATPCRIKNSPEDMVWLWFHWASVNHCTSIQRAKWSAAGRDNRNELPGASTYLKNRSRKPCSYFVRRDDYDFFCCFFEKQWPNRWDLHSCHVWSGRSHSREGQRLKGLQSILHGSVLLSTRGICNTCLSWWFRYRCTLNHRLHRKMMFCNIYTAKSCYEF